MQLQPQITFRNLDTSPTVKELIEERVAALEKFFDRITACKVLIEAGNRRHRQGRIYHVTVRLIVPGEEIIVKRDPSEHHAHEDIRVAVRDAFDAARRQLEDHARRVRGQTKAHEAADVGRVSTLFPERDYGFLTSAAGEEIYMHRNAVVGGGFDKLCVGDEVRYVVRPGEGEHGMQASTVIPRGKSRPAGPPSSPL